MNVAIAQLQATTDAERNLARAHTAMRRAAERGAMLVAFPEVYSAWDPACTTAEQVRPLAQALDGPFVSGLGRAAADAGVWAVCGMLERVDGDETRVYNTTVIVDDRGKLAAAYRKTHLFDA